jgi:transcriptional regulator with XRE-family HTH domain
MATNLAPVDSREVLRCDACGLVQFRGSNTICRRCKAPFEKVPEVEQAATTCAPPPILSAPKLTPARRFAAEPLPPVVANIRALRERAGLTQEQLARRMSVVRTFISRIETGQFFCPWLGGLERIATALRVRVLDLLTTSHTTEDEIRELSQDEFISELMPEMVKLDMELWPAVLLQVRELVDKRKIPRSMNNGN